MTDTGSLQATVWQIAKITENIILTINSEIINFKSVWIWNCLTSL
jgi:hypothetical protein